jgi:hypothetical protein
MKPLTSGLLGLTVAGWLTVGVIDRVMASAAVQSSPRSSTVDTASSVHDGPWLGTFKRRDPATSPETTVLTMRKEGDGIRYVIDVTRPDGPSRQMAAFVRFDGKPYPETGNPTADYNVFERVDARTLHLVDLKDGKETARFRITYSADGRVRTSVSTRPGPDGRPVSSTAVWDRID